MKFYAVFECYGEYMDLLQMFDTQEEAKEWVESIHSLENFVIEEWEI